MSNANSTENWSQTEGFKRRVNFVLFLMNHCSHWKSPEFNSQQRNEAALSQQEREKKWKILLPCLLIVTSCLRVAWEWKGKREGVEIITSVLDHSCWRKSRWRNKETEDYGWRVSNKLWRFNTANKLDFELFKQTFWAEFGELWHFNFCL